LSLFLGSNHLLYHAFEISICFWVFSVEILELPLGYDSIGEGLNNFSLYYVMDLLVEISKVLAALFLSPFSSTYVIGCVMMHVKFS
jgi:hypothetical protein